MYRRCELMTGGYDLSVEKTSLGRRCRSWTKRTRGVTQVKRRGKSISGGGTNLCKSPVSRRRHGELLETERWGGGVMESKKSLW